MQQIIDDPYQVLRPMKFGPKIDPSKEHAYRDRPAMIMSFLVHDGGEQDTLTCQVALQKVGWYFDKP
jgi:hypothetical protein